MPCVEEMNAQWDVLSAADATSLAAFVQNALPSPEDSSSNASKSSNSKSNDSNSQSSHRASLEDQRKFAVGGCVSKSDHISIAVGNSSNL